MNRIGIVLVALGAAIVGALLVILSLRSEPTAVSPVATASAAEVAASPVPAPPPTIAAPAIAEVADAPPVAASSAPAPQTFAEAMASEDPFAQRAAIEAAVARGDVTALPALQKVDLTKDGYVAAAAIDGVGKLAALAPESEKKAAVRTLSTWLASESKRKTNDALGNVSILVDAFADTKSSEAIAPLVAALDSAAHPIHIETRIVESLVALNARSAAPSVARFAARVRKMSPSDELEKALVTEALQTADAAVAKWSAPE